MECHIFISKTSSVYIWLERHKITKNGSANNNPKSENKKSSKRIIYKSNNYFVEGFLAASLKPCSTEYGGDQLSVFFVWEISN